MKKLKNGVLTDLTQEELDLREADRLQYEAEANHYTAKRRNAYPDLGEQLDMLYKDALNGTTVWKDLITSIKAQYPKE